MKVKPSVKKICDKCKVIRRHGRVMVICDNLRHNGERFRAALQVFLQQAGDADLAAAVSTAAFSVAIHAGQGCALTTRLLVPRERYDEAVQVAAATMESIGAKDPRDPGTICGPVISRVDVVMFLV